MNTIQEFNKIFLKNYNNEFNCSLRYMTYFAHGKCYYYAYCFQQCLGGEVFSYLCPYKQSGHCFIKYKGKYFDAENPEGVENWKDLQRYLKKVRRPLHKNSNLGVLSRWKVSSEEKKQWTKISGLIKTNLPS